MSEQKQPASMALKSSAATPEEILPTLCSLRASLELLNKAVLLQEAVKGVRLVEPRNDLSHELKEINWCIARISGATWLEAPPAAEPKADPALRRRTENDRDGHPA